MTKRSEQPSATEQADRNASAKANRERDAFPMRLLGAVSDVGDQPQMRTLCGAFIAVAIVRGDDRLARTGLRMLVAHSIATWGKSVVKAVVDRTRPESGDRPELRLGGSDVHEENSFPSGHSAGAVAVAQAVARAYPEKALAARAAALMVAAVQVPRGTHYIGDVVVGTLIGLAGEQVSDAALEFVISAASAGAGE